MKIRIKKTGEIVDAVEYKDAYYVTYGPSEYWGFFPKQDAEVVEEPTVLEKELAEFTVLMASIPPGCGKKTPKKEEESKMKISKTEFDFEDIWRHITPYPGETESMIGVLRGFYDRMQEWGFEYIHIHWGKGVIEVSGAGVPFLHKPFTDICDFPRALKEAFYFMWKERKKPKLECIEVDCSKVYLSVDNFEEEMLEMIGAHYRNGRIASPIKITREQEKKLREKVPYKYELTLDKYMSPWAKHKIVVVPKQKCDKDGPCDDLKKHKEFLRKHGLGYDGNYCECCGERR